MSSSRTIKLPSSLDSIINTVQPIMSSLHPDVQTAIHALIARARQTDQVLATIEQLKASLTQAFQKAQAAFGDPPTAVATPDGRRSTKSASVSARERILTVMRKSDEPFIPTTALRTAVGLQDDPVAFRREMSLLCEEGLARTKGTRRGMKYGLTAKGRASSSL
jgi:hypothetical protein